MEFIILQRTHKLFVLTALNGQLQSENVFWFFFFFKEVLSVVSQHFGLQLSYFALSLHGLQKYFYVFMSSHFHVGLCFKKLEDTVIVQQHTRAMPSVWLIKTAMIRADHDSSTISE